MRLASGSVTSTDPLVTFFYILSRDYMTPGEIEEILEKHVSLKTVQFTNGWLALYAKDLAMRFRNHPGDPVVPAKPEMPRNFNVSP